MFGLFNWLQSLITGLVLATYGLVFGAIVGAVIGLLVHAFQRGRRDFRAVSSLRPRYYDITVDVEVADRAIHIVAGSDSRKE